MIRLPFFAIAWAAYFALSLPLVVLGVPLIAVLAALPQATARRPSQHYKDGRIVTVWTWRWINYIWGNDEDGVDGMPLASQSVTIGIDGVQGRQGWWVQKTAGWSRWRIIFMWAALRNSTANLRFAPFFGMVIDPTQVHSVAGGSWWLAWQHCKSGFWFSWNVNRYFWIGWKVKPADANMNALRLPDGDGRLPGAGFAFQPYRRFKK